MTSTPPSTPWSKWPYFINEQTLVVTVNDVKKLNGHNPIDGECLQILREFGREAQILVVGEDQSLVRTTLVELLPDSFGPNALEL